MTFNLPVNRSPPVVFNDPDNIIDFYLSEDERANKWMTEDKDTIFVTMKETIKLNPSDRAEWCNIECKCPPIMSISREGNCRMDSGTMLSFWAQFKLPESLTKRMFSFK